MLTSHFLYLLAVDLDALDKSAIAVYLCLVVALPLLGYWFMVIDIRAYLRALRGALIIVKNHLPGIPQWARQYTPGSIRALGLELPCTEEDIKRKYRQLAETLHPDRGGDRQKFMLLQKQFEEAVRFVRENSKNGPTNQKA